MLHTQIRVLSLQVAELERSIHISRASMPDISGIDKEVAALKAGLLKVGCAYAHVFLGVNAGGRGG